MKSLQCDWCKAPIPPNPEPYKENVKVTLPGTPHLTVVVAVGAMPQRLDEDDEEDICWGCAREAVKLAAKKLGK